MMKILSKIYRQQKGLSLVELLIVLALLGIILAVGYNYFYFGTQAFARGERYAIAQQASRHASDIITREIRFAHEIEINPTGGISVDDFDYIYLENDSIKVREGGVVRILADSNADDIAYSIFFTSNVPNDVVYFYVFADLPESVDLSGYMVMVDGDWILNETELEEDGVYSLYYLKTKVQALNLKLFNTYGQNAELIKLEGNGGLVLKYKKPVY